jgi:PTS system nitrogen regulatory IIA component
MYLNLVQIAESFGVSEKVIEEWIRDEGLPHMSDRGRLLFDRAQVAQWAAKHGLASQVGFLAPGRSAFESDVQLESLLRNGGIWRDVAWADVADVYERVLGGLPGVTPQVRQLLAQRLRAPGGVTLAPVGAGFAMPHPATRVSLGKHSGAVALIFLRDAAPAGAAAVDDVPIRVLFFFVAPSPRAHLDVLGRLSRFLSDEAARKVLRPEVADDDIFRAVAAFDRGAAHAEGAES